MGQAIQWLRSLFFIIQMYLMMLLLALFFTPMAILKRDWAFHGIHTWCNWVRWTAGWMVGLRSEVRGVVPDGGVIVASKHQSFFDIIILSSVLPRLKFIMKKEIKWAPIVGYYALRINCVAVDRGKRGVAIKQMVADVKSGAAEPGQLIIFPQGTRVQAGAHKPYKIGTSVLYEQTGQVVVPAATNVGVFWKRHGIMRHPGLAVVEFLPEIAPGLSSEAFMDALETSVETASDRLTEEAGRKLGD